MSEQGRAAEGPQVEVAGKAQGGTTRPTPVKRRAR